MVCKLAQIPPEIWMTLPLEAKKWLLNERKRQLHRQYILIYTQITKVWIRVMM
jgi:hypothetical protein